RARLAFLRCPAPGGTEVIMADLAFHQSRQQPVGMRTGVSLRIFPVILEHNLRFIPLFLAYKRWDWHTDPFSLRSCAPFAHLLPLVVVANHLICVTVGNEPAFV